MIWIIIIYIFLGLGVLSIIRLDEADIRIAKGQTNIEPEIGGIGPFLKVVVGWPVFMIGAIALMIFYCWNTKKTTKIHKL